MRWLKVLISVLATFGTFSAQAADDVRIGAIIPMTGDAASLGEWMHKGMSIAIEEINAKWGNRKLIVVFEDSKTNPRDAVTAMNKLLTVDKVHAVMTTLTGVTNALAPIADRNKIVLTTSAVLPGITEQSIYLFRNNTNLGSEINRLVELTSSKYKRPAVIWANLEWAKWGKTAYINGLSKQGIKVVADQSFPADATDMRVQLTQIRVAQPDVVLVIAQKATGVALKQARELGLVAQFIGTLDFDLPDVIAIAKEAAEGAIYTKASFDPQNPSSAAILAYSTKYKNRYGAAPEALSAVMYDMLHMLAEAAAKSTNSEDIRRTLLAIRDYPGASGNTTFLPNRDVDKPVDLKMIKDGKNVPYRP